ncbi:MAG: dTDP-glucose 4,6-dehydratase [Candidatus Angelobacter sp. Gp1-AA117]|nr:MAG: dTDP-glucose 4,6-dehydratase [Candidatus Angelobacter sp. Gp1-AA117]
MQNSIIVTGGAGFIGSNFIHRWIEMEDASVINLDKLTYAGNLASLQAVTESPRYQFVHGDICDQESVRRLLETHAPRAIVHFAAESHVDRSIHGPAEFVRTNIEGTFKLLEEARRYCESLAPVARERFRFLHVSTDEVYGSLEPQGPGFCETTPYAPNSPYSASKAASDHLVRAYHHTYRLSTLTTNCSNNYGPYQFPEKLIPLMILNALQGAALPVYGDGEHRRDWLYVVDHCDAIRAVLVKGQPGQTYNIGGEQEMSNIEVVNIICEVLDKLRPAARSYSKLVQFVKDRPGHDRRYAMNISKIRRELGWEPKESFKSGIRKTVEWYLANPQWVSGVTSGSYRDWIKKQYQGASN